METEKTGIETIYTERYKACFELYLYYGGRNLTAIERDMRARGFTDFHRRIFYGRTDNGIYKPGWIEKFGWKKYLKSVPPAAAGGASRRQDHLKSVPPAVAGGASFDGDDRLCRNGNNSAAETPQSAVRTPQSDGSAVRNAQSFESWLKQVSPDLTWDWPYQKYIYKHLQRVTDGTCKRLMIFMPPRHGKSELVTVRYAGWRLWNDPKLKVIVGSYNQKLADRFSRSIRKLLSEEEDRQLRNEDQGRSADNSPPYEGGVDARVVRGQTGWFSRDGKGLKPVPTAVAGGDHSAGDITAPAYGVVTAPPDIQAAEIDGVIRERAHYPQCDSVGLKSVPPAVAGGALSAGVKNPPANAGGSDRMFPKTRTINTASQWETALGGGVKAVGVGAGITGFGGQVIVIDDPVKSRAEAESQTYRERLWDWYRNDLYTRLEPGAAVILIQTRWHVDDLAGRLLQEMHDGGDQWEVIDLPALAEDTETRRKGVEEQSALFPVSLSPLFPVSPSDPLGRPVGAALCPDRFDEGKLADIRSQLGSYNFSALYQQHPTPAEGGIFKRAWFTRIVDRAPEGLIWKRGYDLAVSTKTSSCYTSSFRVAYDDAGDLYIADGFRKRIEYPDQRRYIVSRLAAEPDTEHGIEKALHGEAIIQDIRREKKIRGSNLRGVRVTADKITRALKWAPLAEEGKVVLVRGPWNREFIEEVCRFPGGKFDDQVDAVSLAVTMFRRQPKGLVAFH
ncbi:MAG: phage terminase large subunit [Chloracidobacterium sp.]|nr:phage terminase large subunit [Chloracidobacterium sp.]